MIKFLIGGGLLFVVSIAFAAGGAYVTVNGHVSSTELHFGSQTRDSIFDMLENLSRDNKDIQREMLLNRKLICIHVEGARGVQFPSCDDVRVSR